MKLLLIGQAPSKFGDPRLPLTGRAGRKIAKLAGVSTFRYLRRTDRLNLLGRWTGKRGKGDNFPAAEATAKAIKASPLLKGRWVIFVGRAVADAFRVSLERYCTWVWDSELDCMFAILPHPSGIVRWWNDRENTELASAFLRGAFKKRRP